jgi:uncharacterized alkaline shock family protein YloU
VSLVIPSENGTVTVPESVLLQIAVRAAEGVEGVRVRRRRSVDVEARAVRLELAARRGQVLPEAGAAVQEAVAAALRTMCGLDVRVDVAFEELS